MQFHRIDYTRHVPDAFKGLVAISQQLHQGRLGAELAELVFLRVSQLNGCAYCIDMHATALRKAGVAARKLDTLPAWRESPFYDAGERAALDWAEALTTLPAGAPPDEVYDALLPLFDEATISELTMAIATINAWNRLGVGLRPALP